MTTSSIVRVTVTFPAVDDPNEVADAIGNLFDAVLTTSGWHLHAKRDDMTYDPLDDVPFLDSRVQVKTPWALDDPFDAPTNMFSA
jgi:hypothetical protein